MPKQSAIVLSLSIIGLSVPLVALLWCAWRRSLELGARRQQRRSTPPKTAGQPAAVSYLPSSWKGVSVSATDIWSGIGAAALLVGSVALSAVPSVLGGRNTAARCTAVEVIEVLGPALVLFGVAACSPRHVPALASGGAGGCAAEGNPNPITLALALALALTLTLSLALALALTLTLTLTRRTTASGRKGSSILC